MPSSQWSIISSDSSAPSNHTLTTSSEGSDKLLSFPDTPTTRIKIAQILEYIGFSPADKVLFVGEGSYNKVYKLHWKNFPQQLKFCGQLGLRLTCRGFGDDKDDDVEPENLKRFSLECKAEHIVTSAVAAALPYSKARVYFASSTSENSAGCPFMLMQYLECMRIDRTSFSTDEMQDIIDAIARQDHGLSTLTKPTSGLACPTKQNLLRAGYQKKIL